MCMNGTLAELMAKTDPKEVPNGWERKESPILPPQKALYGMMKSALLFYRKFISELKGMGFEINPYDPVRRYQNDEWQSNDGEMARGWSNDQSHQQGGNISVSPSAEQHMEIILLTIPGEYMTISEWYLISRVWDKVKINMTKYLSRVIADFPEEKIGKAATPAGDHLFRVRDERWNLNEEQVDAFHHTVWRRAVLMVNNT